MKKLFYIIPFLFLGVVSCGDLAEINEDPNKSPSANPAQVLTSAIGYLSWIVDGRFNEYSHLWGQYWTWGPGVSLGNQERFDPEPDDFNNVWSRCYADCLADLQFLVNSDDPAFQGIGNILQAYVYQALVDHFGDVPYSEALRGEIADGAILSPAYDDDGAIYDGLLAQIDAGLNALAGASNIGAEDLIYGGDVKKWAKFGNSLKLRVLMRQSEVKDVSGAVTSLMGSGDFIASGADMAQIAMAGSAGDENPMYATREAGVGFFYIASNASLNVLGDLADPRTTAIYDYNRDTLIVGIDQGSIDNEPFTAVTEEYSQGSAAMYGPANSVILMSDWEVWFLRAEAGARFSGDGAGAFQNALDAHFGYLNVPGSDSYGSGLDFAGGSLDEQINMIGVQKWISMNGLQEDEGWIEARRFDRPGNRIFTEGIWQTPLKTALPDGVFPSTWLYPESEQSLNGNAPTQRAITENVFWDN